MTDWDWNPHSVSAIAECITAAGLFVAIFQIFVENGRARRQAALELLMESSRSRPVNSGPSVRLMAALEQEQFESVVRRHETELKNDQYEHALKCFSDKTDIELKDLLDNNILTRKGAALLAVRINRVIDGDEAIAIAINHKAADQAMLLDAVRESFSRSIMEIVEMHGISKKNADKGEADADEDEDAYPALRKYFQKYRKKWTQKKAHGAHR
jgi:uncharacterized membrane protein YqiK